MEQQSQGVMNSNLQFSTCTTELPTEGFLHFLAVFLSCISQSGMLEQCIKQCNQKHECVHGHVIVLEN